jgi:hypothetical protein
LGLGLALGAFLKCLFNPNFADEVKDLALNRKLKPDSEPEEVLTKEFDSQKESKQEVAIGEYELGAIQLLSDLQKEGRLVDFLEEDLTEYEDDEIGSSVRGIHEGCKKVMDKILEKEKLLDQEEESSVRVNKDYNPNELKLSGRVSENFPQKGVLVHPGWKVKNLKLSSRPKASSDIICPAEIEIE